MGGVRKYSVDDNFFEIESHEKYWLIGLLASDGSIHGNQIHLYQSGEAGHDVIEYVKRLIAAEAPIYTRKTLRKDSHGIQISSEKFVRDLSIYNVVERKTLSYEMPYIPDEYFSSFVAGYMEGDGCITLINSSEKQGYRYLHASFVGTEEFMRECYRKIPINGSLHKHHTSSVYELRFGGKMPLSSATGYINQTIYTMEENTIYTLRERICLIIRAGRDIKR